MKNNINKTFRSITAGMAAIVIVASGTFAWNALDQVVLNETQGESKGVGARLHDDFNGTNKDIYIENYAEEGGRLVFARIRLDEYMEIGENAGTDAASAEKIILRGDIDESRENSPQREDVTTWDTYLYGSVSDGSEQIRKYRDLVFGGDTFYMPTFNKHIYNLDAEINGTLKGPDGDASTDDDAYLDYESYRSGETLTANAKYATDDQSDENQNPDAFIELNETHTAKPTLKSTMMSMQEWINNGSKLGPYWVYDEDGWAYWAQAIEAQTATGLLLTEITEVVSPSDEWYYAINVVSQMATVGDWDIEDIKGFHVDGITENGEKLINQISGLIEGVGIDVSIESGQVDVEVKEVIKLNAVVSVPSGYDGRVGYSWMVKEVQGNSGLKPNELAACMHEDGRFIGIPNMLGNRYRITASADLNHKVQDSILVNVYSTATVSLDIDTAGYKVVEAGKTLKATANVDGLLDETVTWSITGGSENTTIDDNGLLSVDINQEASSMITIRAESNVNSEIFKEITITVLPSNDISSDDTN